MEKEGVERIVVTSFLDEVAGGGNVVEGTRVATWSLRGFSYRIDDVLCKGRTVKEGGMSKLASVHLILKVARCHESKTDYEAPSQLSSVNLKHLD